MNEYRASHACPSPAVLAAFVEGTLDADTRGAVAQHIVTCSDCVHVAGETARFLAEEQEEAENDSDPAPRRRSWPMATAAAFAATCLLLAAWWYAASRDPLRHLKTLAARADVRVIDGRLTGFPHRRIAATRSERRPWIELDGKAELERLSQSRRDDPSALHAAAVAFLMSGEAERAVDLLATAARLRPDSAAIWNDLAAAAIATRSDADALIAANRAVTLAPDAPAPHFNRALALSRLGRYRDAAQAYAEALRHERDSGWRDEIRERQSLLPR